MKRREFLGLVAGGMAWPVAESGSGTDDAADRLPQQPVTR